MKRDYSKEYKIFETLYADIREWLKFSESKNAALITLNVATLFGAVKLFTAEELINNYFNIGLLVSLGSSILINLYSFFPQKSMSIESYDTNEDENLLFYYNIKRVGKHMVFKRLSQKYFGEIIEDNYLKDLSKQIYDLSYLVDEKNTCFKYGVMFTAFAYILGIIHILSN